MGTAMMLYDDQAASGSVVGPASAMPLTNLQSDRLERVWRSLSDDPANTKFDVSLPDIIAMRAVIIGPTNLTTAHKYRLRAFSDALRTTTIYDSDWVQSSVRAVFGTLPWRSPYLWTGYQPQDDPDRGAFIIHVLPSIVAQLYWSVEIDDRGNPAGYVEASRLLMCRAVSPSINYKYGGNLGFQDNSLRQPTLAGGEATWRRVNPRIFNCGFDYLPEAEAFSDFYDLMRHTGFDREVFIIPDPDAGGLELQRRSFLGTFSQMDPLTQAAFGHVGTGFTIKERI